ncbi:unnamed protein product [Cyprideis torosa]|uniref:Uncharacterized protein n=1 Tax=Cyprideis torosa TaxID=163714 RepID=A0A7R8W8T4_9CRUS|nr:unnamed protein product [Cyprideis torosa]CAG0886581.1 unnamed protein product [Cyprideis torosa]
MREQAIKMNVASLRCNANLNETSAEIRLAKVAICTIALWFLAWTPYLIINYVAMFDREKITPLFTVWGNVFAKFSAAYNPIVYGISHPRYRSALFKKMPWLDCARESPEDTESVAMSSCSLSQSNGNGNDLA